MTSNPSPAELRSAAEAERHDLLMHAMAKHLGNIESELRRYREDVRRIESVYELRLSVLPPDTSSLREQIVFWLSGPGVPPMGWTVYQIADQVGAPAMTVRTELDAMMAERLARYAVSGRRTTWFLLAEPDGCDAAVEAEAEADAAEQRTTLALEWHDGTHPWGKHDGFPRHQHSLNGVLTIAPNDTQPHFAHGPGFAPAAEHRK